LGDYLITLMEGVTWSLHNQEQWVIFGINGSGKTLLSDFLLGRLGLLKGEYQVKKGLRIGGFGFEQQQEIIARERYLDESEFMDSEDPGTSVRQWIQDETDDRTKDYDLDALALKLDSVGILERGLRYLSAGELRKAALLKILGSSAQVLILDEPYEGLDVKSRGELRLLLQSLVKKGRTLLLLCQRDYELPDFITHGLVVNDRTLHCQGAIDVARKEFDRLVQEESTLQWNEGLLKELFPQPKRSSTLPIIEMKGVTVQYNDFVVFQDLNWTVGPGEHWLILGPNGSGKSTLLNLIFGEK
jgi:molybdate transport system ATP-binding protein